MSSNNSSDCCINLVRLFLSVQDLFVIVEELNFAVNTLPHECATGMGRWVYVNG
jgi:hypothetical protein